MSTRKEWAQVANQRAALLGLQLQLELAGQRVSDACAASSGVPSLARAVELCLQDGVLQAQLSQAKEEQHRVQQFMDLLASSLASTQTPKQGTIQLLGRQRSRAHAAAMLEHVQDWLNRLKATIANLQDVLKGPARSEFLRYFNTPAASQQHLQHIDALLNNANTLATLSPGSVSKEQQHSRQNGVGPGMAAAGSSSHAEAVKQLQPKLLPRPGAGGLSAGAQTSRRVTDAAAGPQARSLPAALSCPIHPQRPAVAHFVGQVPVPVMRALRLPPVDSAAAASSARPHATDSKGGGAGVHHVLTTQGASCWAAAPTLTDPDTSITHAVAVHRSLEQALAVAQDGDVVLLQPGRYSMGGSTGSDSGGEDGAPSAAAALTSGVLGPLAVDGGPLRRSIRIIGLGMRRQEVVLYNAEEDDQLLETAAAPGTPGVMLENLTLAQLGGYEGVVQVHTGQLTALDVELQCSMSGAWVRRGASLMLSGCRLSGCASSAVQVENGAHVELHDVEVCNAGGGDDVVPRDLGALEVHVKLADYVQEPLSTAGAAASTSSTAACGGPRPLTLVLNADDLQRLCTAGCMRTLQASGPLHTGPSSQSAGAGAASGEAAAQASNGAAGEGSSSSGSSAWSKAWEAAVSNILCSVDPRPAVVIVGPGCRLHSNKGFAVSVVKGRALAALHESVHGTGSVGAALEGAAVYVAAGAQLAGNTRGPLGVVEEEYVELDGDQVQSKTSARFFHAAQLSAKQLRDGFASKGMDWSKVRAGLVSRMAAEGGSASAHSSGLRRLLVGVCAKHWRSQQSRHAARGGARAAGSSVNGRSKVRGASWGRSHGAGSESSTDGSESDDEYEACQGGSSSEWSEQEQEQEQVQRAGDVEEEGTEQERQGKEEREEEQQELEQEEGGGRELPQEATAIAGQGHVTGTLSPDVPDPGHHLSAELLQQLHLESGPVQAMGTPPEEALHGVEQVHGPHALPLPLSLPLPLHQPLGQGSIRAPTHPPPPSNGSDGDRSSCSTPFEGSGWQVHGPGRFSTQGPVVCDENGGEGGDRPRVRSHSHSSSKGGSRRCWCCGAQDVPLRSCAACKRASYCGPECQRADWRMHRQECGLWASVLQGTRGGRAPTGPNNEREQG